MRNYFLLCCSLLFFFTAATAQPDKSLRVSFGTGVYNTPYYHDSYEGSFYRIAFDYHLAKRHVLSAMYLAGRHYYSNTTDANVVQGSEKGNRSTRNANQVAGVLYQYKLLYKPRWEVSGGAGVGLLTQTENYLYRFGNTNVPYTSNWTDLVFPTTMSMYYKPSKDWQLGIVSGMVVHPDFPTLGWHLGATLAYVIQ